MASKDWFETAEVVVVFQVVVVDKMSGHDG